MHDAHPAPDTDASLDFFIDACPFAIIEWGRDMRVLRWSADAERVFGWRAEEVLGKRPDDWGFTHPEDRDAVKRAIGQAFTGTKPDPVVGRNFTRDGKLLHCEWHNRVRRDARGRIVSLLSFAKDLTRQYHAEDALDASEARYASIFTNSHAVMLIIDPATFEIVDANPAAEAFYAWPRKHLQRMLISDINMLTPAQIRTEMDAARDAGRFHFNFRHRRADGSIRDVEVYSGPLALGSRALLFSIVHDVSARKAAESTLRKLSRAVEQSPESIVITNLAAEIEYVNASFTQRSGYTPAEVIGQNPRILQSGKTPRRTYQDMWATLARSDTWSGELHNRSKDGREYFERATITPIHDETGGVTHYVAVKEDITKARHLEAELQRYREHLEHLVDTRTRELSAALEAAQAANRAKSDFLATMSHEIRTPMNGVVGLVDLLTHSGLSAEQHELVDTMQASAAILLHLIDDILDFSRIESGHLELDMQAVELAPLVERAVDNLQPLATRKEVGLSVFIAPDLPARLLIDGLRLQQIITNLTGNAIKFSSGTARAGKVELRITHKAPEHLSITLEDNGIGIDAQAQSRLFEPFAQAERSTTRRFGGTGLGLAITRRLVDLLGGEISVRSVVGEGSCFTVLLPLQAVPGDGTQADATSLAGLTCILCVEDPRRLTDLGAYLAHAGARLKRARSVVQALHFLAATDSRSYVLITDCPLPAAARQQWQAIAAATRPGVVLIAHGARRHARREEERIYSVDLEGMHHHSLIEAVGLASGRVAAPPIGVANRTARADAPKVSIGPAIAPILVAEDNEINRKVISRQLELLGVRCEMAEDGEEALSRWRKGHYSMLLTDLHMPRMDGYTLTARIRAEEAPGTRLPIIAVTANALRGEDQRCVEAGMNDYVVKPVQLEALKAALERHLASGTDEAPSAADTRRIDTTQAATPANTPASPPDATLDTAVLARLIGDAAALIDELLQDFAQSAREAGAEISEALRTDNWQHAGPVAHRLKSAARSVGAMALGTLCAEIEQAARQTTPPAALPLVERFAEALDRALDAIATRASGTTGP